MKCTAFVTLLFFVPAALAVGIDPVVVAREARAGISVASRDELSEGVCKPTSCSCEGIPNGLFCGDGLLHCVPGHVYQCGGDGKKSCDFGIRKSCVKCNKLQC